MPPAKKPAARASRAAASYKEPAALARLKKSLDAAQAALGELSKHAGRDVSQGARDAHKNLRTFVTSARRDTGKFGTAIQRDFEQAQKKVAAAAPVRKAAASARKPAATAKKPAATAAKPAASARAKRTTRAAPKRAARKAR